jgi:hypothetical protein
LFGSLSRQTGPSEWAAVKRLNTAVEYYSAVLEYLRALEAAGVEDQDTQDLIRATKYRLESAYRSSRSRSVEPRAESILRRIGREIDARGPEARP